MFYFFLYSYLAATYKNGATCTADGIVLDGNDDYVDIDDFEFGGTISVEVFIKYDSFNSWSRVLDFGGSGGKTGGENIILANEGTSSKIVWEVRNGLIGRHVYDGTFDGWTHVVVTVKGDTMKVYKNGAFVDSSTVAWEPRTTTRTNHWLGKSSHTGDGNFDGTIAYLKMWNDEVRRQPFYSLPESN